LEKGILLDKLYYNVDISVKLLFAHIFF
jgi:hypothetical protein